MPCALIDSDVEFEASIKAWIFDSGPPYPAAGLGAIVDVSAIVGASVVASLEPPAPPAGLSVIVDVSAIVGASVVASLAEPPAPGEPVMVCPVGATALLMDGEPHSFEGGSLFIGASASWVVASIAGKRMRFKSEDTAGRWCEIVVVRAASEVGLSSALPAASRDLWKSRKLESLAAYQERIVSAAAKLPAGSDGQIALLNELAIVQEKMDSI